MRSSYKVAVGEFPLSFPLQPSGVLLSWTCAKMGLGELWVPSQNGQFSLLCCCVVLFVLFCCHKISPVRGKKRNNWQQHGLSWEGTLWIWNWISPHVGKSFVDFRISSGNSSLPQKFKVRVRECGNRSGKDWFGNVGVYGMGQLAIGNLLQPTCCRITWHGQLGKGQLGTW